MKFPQVVVGALILNKKGEILLVKSHKWKNLWGLPGGKLKYGESIASALKREVKEETGMKIKVVKMITLQEAIFSKEFHGKKHFIFIDYLCSTNSSKVRLDKRELQEYLWIKPNKALKLKNLDSFAKRFIEEYLKASK